MFPGAGRAITWSCHPMKDSLADSCPSEKDNALAQPPYYLGARTAAPSAGCVNSPDTDAGTTRV